MPCSFTQFYAYFLYVSHFYKSGELFGDNMIANAILDRLIHHSHIINDNGDSYRIKDKMKKESDQSESS